MLEANIMETVRIGEETSCNVSVIHTILKRKISRTGMNHRDFEKKKLQQL